MKKRIFAVLLALALTVSLLPLGALAAEGDTMDLATFITTLEENHYVYDGQGVTVKWSASSGCWTNHDSDSASCILVESNVKFKKADGNTPKRHQGVNDQYQLFENLDEDISISNVNFAYVPAPYTMCRGDGVDPFGWSGSRVEGELSNAELQFNNLGSLTIDNCTFDKVVVSPYNHVGTTSTAENKNSFSIYGCSFENIYNTYAIKDIYPANVTITNCSFDNLSGGIYLEGNSERGEIIISNNKFNNVDTWAEDGKENTRGVIQFSAAVNLTKAEITISGNTITGNLPENDLPVLRQLCNADTTINGWTPGEMFTIKADADNKALPNLPSDATHIFLGWSTHKDGTTAEVKAGGKAENGEFYYSVWQTLKLEGNKSASWIYGQQSRTAEVTLTIPGASYVLDGKTVCLVGNGSTLTDVIGGGFVLADIGSISMSEGGTALAAVREGNSVTFGDGGYTVSYDRGTNTLTLEINKDIDETTDAELSYRVYLAREPQRAGRYSLETNESAVLSYGDTGEFTYNVPALEYVVLPSYDPGPVNPVEPDEPDEPDEPEAPGVPELERDDHFGYIVGRTETTVAPEADITRAEVATIFFRLLTDESRAAFWSTESGFTDVDAGDWYNNAVATMANAGVVNGYEDGAFRPDAPITRAEFAAMAVRFYESEAEIDHDAFSDIASSWARDEINLAHALDIVGGYSDGTFRPNANITRAEAVTIINNVLGREPDAANLHPDMKVWDDNSPDAWYYADIQEATNSHTYSRDGGSEYWLTIEPLRDWEALEAEWANAYGK